MKNLLVLFFFMFVQNTSAQLRPSQSQYLKELGALINPGFEQGRTGWNITTSGCTASVTQDIPYLNQSLEIDCTSGTFSVKQEFTTLTSFEGQQGLLSVQVKSGVSGVEAATLANGSRETTLAIDPGTTYRKPEIPFVINGTSNGVEVFADSAITGTVYIDLAQAGLSPGLVSDIIVDDTYSAKISSSGVVSDESVDWIDGNASIASTSQYSLTFISSVFGLAPNCVATPLNNAVTATIQEFTAVTSSGGTWRTARSDTSVSTAMDWRLICAKHSNDYERIQVVSQTTSLDFQEKILAADDNTDGAVPTLEITGLTIGKRYEVKLQTALRSNSSTGFIEVDAINNSVVVASTRYDSPSSADTGGSTVTTIASFVAQATNLTVETTSSGTNLILDGDGSKKETFIQVKEAPLSGVIVGTFQNVPTSSSPSSKIESCTVVDSAGTPDIDTRTGANSLCDGWVDGIQDIGTGTYDVQFNGHFNNLRPNCTCVPEDNVRICHVNDGNGAPGDEQRVRLYTTGNTLIDGSFKIICHGEK